MKFMVCPQCGIANFYVKNNQAERLNVKVTRELNPTCIKTQSKAQKPTNFNPFDLLSG